MSTLNSTLTTLAQQFASQVLFALQSSSLSELSSQIGGGSSASSVKAIVSKKPVGRPAGRPVGRPAGSTNAVKAAPAAKAAPAVKVAAPKAVKKVKAGKIGRLPRRNMEDIVATRAQIVALLADAPEGMRAEDIRVKLGLDKKELPRPIADAVAAGQIAKKGQKRATMYFSVGGKGGKGGKGKK
jgi:hypothetical protein